MWSIVFTPDERFIIAGDLSGNLSVRESGNTILLHRNAHKKGIHALVISSDGRLLISGGADGRVRVWSWSPQQPSLKLLNTLLIGPQCVYSLALLNDEWILAGTENGQQGQVFFGQISDPVWRTSLSMPRSNAIRALAISPDGRTFFTGSADKLVRAWSTADKTCLSEGRGHSGTVFTLAVTSSGQKIVSGSRDTTIRVWRWWSGRLELHHVLYGHSDSVTAVAVSKNERRIFSCGRDAVIITWDLESGARLSTFEDAHKGIITSLALSRSGEQLASCGLQGEVRIQPLPADALPSSQAQAVMMDSRQASNKDRQSDIAAVATDPNPEDELDASEPEAKRAHRMPPMVEEHIEEEPDVPETPKSPFATFSLQVEGQESPQKRKKSSSASGAANELINFGCFAVLLSSADDMEHIADVFRSSTSKSYYNLLWTNVISLKDVGFTDHALRSEAQTYWTILRLKTSPLIPTDVKLEDLPRHLARELRATYESCVVRVGSCTLFFLRTDSGNQSEAFHRALHHRQLLELLVKEKGALQSVDPGSRRKLFSVPQVLPEGRVKEMPATNVFEQQQIVAQELLTKITTRLDDLRASFEKLKFLIIVPNDVLLREQTKTRLREYNQATGLGLSDDDIDRAVINASKSAQAREVRTQLKRLVDENPTTLLLIIHDECHWGINSGGAVSNLLDDFNGKKNVVFVHVSATPENLILRTELDQNRAVDMEFEAEQRGLETGYAGRKRLAEYGYFIPSHLDQIELSSPLWLLEQHANGVDLVDLECCRLIRDYCLSMSQPDAVNTATNYAIQQAFRYKGMCAVRFPPKRTNRPDFSHLFGEVLCDERLRGIRKRPEAFMEFFLNTGDSPIRLEDIEDESNKELVKQRVARRLQLDNPSDRTEVQIAELRDIPCIMAVVHKARMGTTFPKESFVAWDLRLVYRSSPLSRLNYSTFIQDLGRAFGFVNKTGGSSSSQSDDRPPQRPIVLLSPEGYRLANEEYDIAIQTILPGRHVSKCKTTKSVRRVSELDGNAVAAVQSPNGASLDQPMHYTDTLRQIWAMTKMNMYRNVDMSNRFVLLARPQMGKTGTFLCLIHSLRGYIGRVEAMDEVRNPESRFREMNALFYPMPSADLQQLLWKNNQVQFNRYHLLYREFARRPVDAQPPWRLACALVEDELQELEEDAPPILVADLGCGEAHIAQYFNGNTRVKVTSFDLCTFASTNPCWSEAYAACNVIAADITALTEEQAPSDHYDYVFCNLAFMGNYGGMLQQAHRILKGQGVFIGFELQSHCANCNQIWIGRFMQGLKDLGFFRTAAEPFFEWYVPLLKFSATKRRKKSGKNMQQRAVFPQLTIQRPITIVAPPMNDSPSAPLQSVDGYSGLQNNDNICYLNSIVQCFLNYGEALPDVLEEGLAGDVVRELHSLQSSYGQTPSLETTHLVTTLQKYAVEFKSDLLFDGTQQCACECFDMLLACFEEASTIPFQLQLRDSLVRSYMLPYLTSDAQPQVPADYTEQNLVYQVQRFDANGTKLCNPVAIPLDLKKSYRLYAIVKHEGGTANCGHYTVIIRTPRGWLHFDDENVCRVPVTEIDLQQTRATAYILWYRRSDVGSGRTSLSGQTSPGNTGTR
eukprot:m.50392 g.50392  ORF g.50392 m.50392 type:complete len:1611 (+) comp12543_c1_seq1:178-5010(+)